MEENMKKKIISFGICPFVQRAIITMNFKKIPYEVEYIDLKVKPEWFLKISPFGKVPVLQDGDEIIFESAVINEYLDEISDSSLMGTDTLEKAKARGLIEVASSATMNLFKVSIAQSKDETEVSKAALEKDLEFLLKNFKGPFYKGNNFSLIDTSVIPILHRLKILQKLSDSLIMDETSKQKLKQWMDSTLDLDIVKKSVPASFENDFKSFLKEKGSVLV
jgi:glutathione S-transferase